MGKYFGTDGFRGEANVNLTVDHAFKVGRYVGWHYGRNHKAKDRDRQGYQTQQLYVRVCAGCRTDGVRSRRVSASCDHNAQRFLCGTNRGF